MKKLFENWNTYKDNYINNLIAKDKLNYNVLNHTDLFRLHDFSNSLDMNAVYENFVRQIAGAELSADENTNLREDIEQAEEKKQIEKQIKVLQAKIRKEKQFNRKVELNNELKRLKKIICKI